MFTNLYSGVIIKLVMKMKVKMFRNIWVAIAVLNTLFYINFSSQLTEFIFNPQITTHYKFIPFIGALQILPLPFALFCSWPLFKRYLYNPIPKKAFHLFTLHFVALLILPFLFYPSRTEITSDTITKHNLIGQVSEVYRIEDAANVETGLSAQSSATKRGLRNYLYFTYKINYKDGSVYDLEEFNNNSLREIVNDIDIYVRENNIPKKIHGQVYYDKLLDFNNYSDFFEYRDILGIIMEIKE